MTSPIVSIVIPCYRGERYLAEAIASCLSQHYRTLEVLVVDDCSPDRCAEIAQSYSQKDSRVRLIRRRRNGGVSRAFNTGFQAAQGAYFTRLAQDDLLQPDAVERMVTYLSEHPEIGLVYGDMLKIDEEGRPLERYVTFDPNRALITGNRVGMWAMWRREVGKQAGQFDPLFDTVEDYEFFCRAARICRMARLEGEPGLLFRQHPEMGSKVYRPRQALTGDLVRRLYNTNPSSTSQAKVYWELSWEFEDVGLWGLAARCAWRAVKLQPTKWLYWRHLAGVLARQILKNKPASLNRQDQVP